MIKSFMLMAAMTALFAFVGVAMGGVEGMAIALLFALGMNAFAWYNSDKMVLRMYKAQPLPTSHSLTRIVSQLTEKANLPMPKVYEIPNDSPMLSPLVETQKTPQLQPQQACYQDCRKKKLLR